MEGGGDLWQSLGMGPEPLEQLGSLPNLELQQDWQDPSLLDPLSMAPGLDGASAFSHGALDMAGSGSASAVQQQTPPQPPQLSKQEAERQRNREKQARFRQRQREKKDQLAEAHEAAAAELQRERERGDQLRAAGAMLSAVQSTKDAYISILNAAAGQQQAGQQEQQQQQQQQQGPCGGWRVTEADSSSPAASAEPSTAAAAAAASSCDAGSSGDALCARFGGLGGCGADVAERLLALSFTERVDVAHQLLRAVEPAKAVLVKHGGRRPDGFALNYEVRHEVGQRLLSEVPQLLEVARAMTPQMALREWSEFSDFVAGVVAAVDEGRLDEVEAQKQLAPAVIYQAVQEAILLAHNPSCLRATVAHTKEPGESDEAAAARWGSMVTDLGFTEEQAREALPIWRDYEEQMAQLAGQSAAALETLRQVQQALCERLLELDAGLSQQTLSSLKLFEAAGTLERQPDSELTVLCHFYGRIGTLSTPLQKARLIARSGHLHPDVPAMVKGLLVHHGVLPKPE